MATQKKAAKRAPRRTSDAVAPPAALPASAAPPSDPPASDAPPPAPPVAMSQSDPQKKPFVPEVLDRTVIAIPLLKEIKAEDEAIARGDDVERKAHALIIDLHLEYPGGRDKARERVVALIREIVAEGHAKGDVDPARQGINAAKSRYSQQYLFARLDGRRIEELVRRDHPVASARGRTAAQPGPAIYRIWPDFAVKPLLTKSISTVKADAALNSFSTTGEGIVWAVMDSGIDALHPHFARHDNLNLAAHGPLEHHDFTVLGGEGGGDGTGALVDTYGHGTHVAGIIAGTMAVTDGDIVAESRYRDETGEVKKQLSRPERISGMAPRCKLLSLKVLDDKGNGEASSLIAAIAMIQELNGNGRHIRIHGVNMSVGYDFEPEWFACGQSPLCVEVDRLVKSGVVVVVAAGNSGYGWATAIKGSVSAGLGLTINDPGNADLAVTVGATHRDMPHVYGVSYFSSKGPTGDGRAKPDLVAPGEKIISCASGWRAEDPEAADVAEARAANAARLTALKATFTRWKQGEATVQAPVPPPARKSRKAAVPAKPTAHYREDSGTSMAAPHVSGVMAAFLSVRREFIGNPERVKEVFLATATDLRRDRYFQGQGLVDLMRAIQSV